MLHRIAAAAINPPAFSPSFNLFSRRCLLSMNSISTSAPGDQHRRQQRSVLRGVVFDMDGTLTVPVIDFAGMYREVLGDESYAKMKSSRIDILHHIETLPPAQQQRAYEVIVRFEQEGLDRLQIMPGALELCGFLDSKQIRRGLITRNVKAAVDLFHEKFGMKFIPALSREFRPYKPDPTPLLHICSTWNIPPNEVMMVGDSLRDDVACGKRAGAYTCLLDETGRYKASEHFTPDLKPDFKVASLLEVFDVLDTHFDLIKVDSDSSTPPPKISDRVLD